MKTKYKFLTSIILPVVLVIISCSGASKSGESILSGRFIMKVAERNVDETFSMKKAGRDTTFNSLTRALSYIPDNTEWNFADDSVLIISKTDNIDYMPDTVAYKISRNSDTLLILSDDFVEKFPVRRMDANRFELDFGDPAFSYQLIRKP